MNALKSVTGFRLKKMKPHEKRVMLQCLGIPTRMLPKSVGDLNNKLVEINENRPEDVAKWFNIVILGIVESGDTLPTDVQAIVDGAKKELALVIKEAVLDETVEKAETYLNDRTEKAQKELIRHAKEAVVKAADKYRPIVIKNGKKTKKLKGVFPEEFERMVQLASARVNQLWVGPAGCGKTYLAGKVAEALDLPAYDQSMSEGISESNFTGWLLPTGANGKFDYVPAPFITAYENGGVFLFDEIDAADSNLLVFMNKAIANDYFFLPQRFKNPKVVKHPDFVCIAAANTYGAGADAQYVGRNALDAATLDRFRAGIITMDYSAAVEEALIDEDILAWGRTIRAKIRQHKLIHVMSTRVMLDLSTMKAQYEWDENDWNETYFADWSEEERRLVA